MDASNWKTEDVGVIFQTWLYPVDWIMKTCDEFVTAPNYDLNQRWLLINEVWGMNLCGGNFKASGQAMTLHNEF